MTQVFRRKKMEYRLIGYFIKNIMKVFSVVVIFFHFCLSVSGQSGLNLSRTVSEEKMKEIYNEIKTPFKYGLVVVPESKNLKIDCPTIFRKGGKWLMTYFVFDGRGYETWLAESKDLLHWTKKGKIMAFSDTLDWDSNQKAGFPALQNPAWEGNYKIAKYNNKYWMSYFGGSTRGYEKGLLSISVAWTRQNPAKVHLWNRSEKPVLMCTDKDVRWWENSTMYKTWVLWDKSRTTGYPFVMYYNARGDSLNPKKGAERIGMAVSDDMKNWKRFVTEPVINHHKGISGDAVIQKIKDVWVMFYFGAFWPNRKDFDAFNRFACSYDLVNWTDWQGKDLIAPSEPYDNWFAHKSCVIKHEGVVYHFYCAVNRNNDRGIAVATSSDLGISQLNFSNKPE